MNCRALSMKGAMSKNSKFFGFLMVKLTFLRMSSPMLRSSVQIRVDNDSRRGYG